MMYFRPPTQTRRSMDTRFDIDELKNACLLVNTAEYCQVTATEACASTLWFKWEIITHLTAWGQDQGQSFWWIQGESVIPIWTGIIYRVPPISHCLYNASNETPRVVSSAIFVMLRELEKACESHFETMTRTVWSNIENVSGPSHYVGDLTNSIDHVVEIISPLIEQKKYLRNFFDKASA